MGLFDKEVNRSICCHAILKEHSDGVHCMECDTLYRVKGGVVIMCDAPSSHGEFDRNDMQEIIDVAKGSGWRYALEEVAEKKQPRVAKLIRDERRANSFRPFVGKGGTVLDFGCGYGGVSVALAKVFDRVISIDGSIERISFLDVMSSQEKLQNIIKICANDPLNLPIAEKSLDAIVLNGVLEYLPQSVDTRHPYEALGKCLKSFHRYLMPGGVIIINTKNRFGWQYLMGARDNAGLKFGPALPLFFSNLIHKIRSGSEYRIVNLSLRKYHSILEDSGFSSIEFYWPISGYQAPDIVVPLSGSEKKEARSEINAYYTGMKKNIILLMFDIGILKYIVPFFTISALARGSEEVEPGIEDDTAAAASR